MSVKNNGMFMVYYIYRYHNIFSPEEMRIFYSYVSQFNTHKQKKEKSKWIRALLKLLGTR